MKSSVSRSRGGVTKHRGYYTVECCAFYEGFLFQARERLRACRSLVFFRPTHGSAARGEQTLRRKHVHIKTKQTAAPSGGVAVNKPRTNSVRGEAMSQDELFESDMAKLS